MLINILCWLFGSPKKARRRSSGGSGGDELVGWLFLALLTLIFLG